MVEPVLELERIEKRFFGVPVLKGVSFRARPGEVLGLVGENGAGKSTLMNILGGCLRADGGSMSLGGLEYAPRDAAEATRRGVAFIHQELNLFPNLSIAENIFLTAFPRLVELPFIHRRVLHRRTRDLLAAVKLELSPATPVGALSPGERQLVEIAKALSLEARLIILDEPTTSLTAPEAGRLFALVERLRAQGKALIYISHALGDVLRLAQEVVVLRDGAVVAAGPREDFTVESLISHLAGRRIDQIYPPRSSAPGEEAVLEARGLSQPGILHRVNFRLRRGEVLGLFGLMGSGRTELARVLFGLDPFHEGEVLTPGGAVGRPGPRRSIRRGVGFLTEDRRQEGLLPAASVSGNIALVSLPSFTRGPGLVESRRLEQAVASAAAAVGVQGVALERQPARSLSGGNQQKALLARWLLQRPQVLLLDEPTRGIDVGARHEVYRIVNDLAAAGTGLLFISSEIEELMGMCDRILVMNRGEIRGSLERRDFDREAILALALGEERA